MWNTLDSKDRPGQEMSTVINRKSEMEERNWTLKLICSSCHHLWGASRLSTSPTSAVHCLLLLGSEGPKKQQL